MGITLSQKSLESPLKLCWWLLEQCWRLVGVTLAVQLMVMERVVESQV